MIESMFKYCEEGIPKAQEVAKKYLEKHPNATLEEIGIAIKEATKSW